MKYLFPIAFIIFMALSTASQSQSFAAPGDTLKDLHFLKQKKGSNNKISSYFDNSHIKFRNDTLYTILLPPMICARCEGIINPFVLKLKEQDTTAEVVLMAFYPKSLALNSYLLKRKFITDHVLACTDDAFLDNFHFSTGELQVGYILKLDRRSGTLIASKSTLGLTMDEEFIHWLISSRAPMTQFIPDKSENMDPDLAPEFDFEKVTSGALNPTNNIILEETPAHPLSLIEYPSFSENLRFISFLDGLSNSINIYTLDEGKGRFLNAFRPGPEEDRMFIARDIGDTLFMFFKQMNIINSMYFGNSMIGDNIMITASLPRIYWEDKKEERIAYFNQPTYLLKDTKTGNTIQCIIPEENQDTMISFSHIDSRCIEEGKYFFLPISKGWPVSGTKNLNWENKSINPFREDFYDKVPLFSVYDSNGRFIKYFDQLDSIFITSKVGYTFSNPLIKSIDGNLWIVNPNSGELRRFPSIESNIPDLKIQLFENNAFESALNPKTNPLDYLKDCSDHIKNSIVDFNILGEDIWYVLKNGEFYEIINIEFNGKKKNDWLLPTIYDNRKANTFKISTHQNKVRVCGIYESPELTSIVLFDP